MASRGTAGHEPSGGSESGPDPATQLPSSRGAGEGAGRGPAEEPAAPLQGLSHLLPRTRGERSKPGKPLGSPPGTPHPPEKTPGATSPFAGLGKMMLPRPVTGVFPSESKAGIKEHPPESEGTLLIWIIVAYCPGLRFIF